MALSIKSDEADRLAREVAAATGETLTAAVVSALRERLDRVRVSRLSSPAERLRRLQVEASGLAVLDARPTDQILGYDEDGLPR